MTQRHSKEQFETAQKIDQEYSRYFTGKWMRVQPAQSWGFSQVTFLRMTTMQLSKIGPAQLLHTLRYIDIWPRGPGQGQSCSRWQGSTNQPLGMV